MTDFNPGDKVRVSYDGIVTDKDTVRWCCSPRAVVSWDGTDMTVEDLLSLSWVTVTPIDPAPAPYTEPRDGDEVEVTVRVNVYEGGAGLWAGTDKRDRHFVEIGPHAFRAAVHEGRVRLVKAAAPQFEAGRIYRDNTGDLFLYSPHPHDCHLPWFDLVRCAWSDEPTNPVPCDVVPREAT